MSIVPIQGAPIQYQFGKGVLERLPDYLNALEIKSVAVLHGERAWQASLPYLNQDGLQDSIRIPVTGHCTKEKVQEIKWLLESKSIDAIIGVGGGTVLDVTKATTAVMNKKTILIPTLAATCAAWTPLSVFYDQKGLFTKYEVFPYSNTLVLVEPEIIAHAPVDYLIAGIGDTLAKYYEANALLEANFAGCSLPVALKVSKSTARICRDVLLEDSEEALQAAANHELTEALERVIETIIMSGGMVGSFGDKFGRVAGAHSIHNGLTEARASHKFLHGAKVAYGILVQLAIEQKWEEINRLLPFYRKINLPYSLKSLGIENEDAELLQKIISKTLLPEESIYFIKQSITETEVSDAIHYIEKLTEAHISA